VSPTVSMVIALPAGRMLPEACDLLATVGVDCRALLTGRRQRVSVGRNRDCVAVRPFDVPVYVESGVCDLGICGKDVLWEQSAEIMELVDLRVGHCWFVVAAPAGRDIQQLTRQRLVDPAQGLDWEVARIRVATKYPAVARACFARRGLDAEIVPLHGAAELAPLVGLADCIVDLVATGRTLRDNGLVELAEIGPVTCRLVANPVSFRLKGNDIRPLVARIRGIVDREAGVGPDPGRSGRQSAI